MVFGSNAAGPNGREVLMEASKFYGTTSLLAEGIQAVGTKGTSYGIPTKSAMLNRLSLSQIKENVSRFLAFARSRQDLTFLVTRIGCGASGYTDDEIAPLFKDAPENCGVDPKWASFGLKTWAQPPHQSRPKFGPPPASK